MKIEKQKDDSLKQKVEGILNAIDALLGIANGTDIPEGDPMLVDLEATDKPAESDMPPEALPRIKTGKDGKAPVDPIEYLLNEVGALRASIGEMKGGIVQRAEIGGMIAKGVSGLPTRGDVQRMIDSAIANLPQDDDPWDGDPPLSPEELGGDVPIIRPKRRK